MKKILGSLMALTIAGTAGSTVVACANTDYHVNPVFDLDSQANKQTINETLQGLNKSTTEQPSGLFNGKTIDQVKVLICNKLAAVVNPSLKLNLTGDDISKQLTFSFYTVAIKTGAKVGEYVKTAVPNNYVLKSGKFISNDQSPKPTTLAVDIYGSSSNKNFLNSYEGIFTTGQTYFDYTGHLSGTGKSMTWNDTTKFSDLEKMIYEKITNLKPNDTYFYATSNQSLINSIYLNADKIGENKWLLNSDNLLSTVFGKDDFYLAVGDNNVDNTNTLQSDADFTVLTLKYKYS